MVRVSFFVRGVDSNPSFPGHFHRNVALQWKHCTGTFGSLDNFHMNFAHPSRNPRGLWFPATHPRCFSIPVETLSRETTVPYHELTGISVPRNTSTVFFYSCGNNCPGGLRSLARNPQRFQFPATHPRFLGFAVEAQQSKTWIGLKTPPPEAVFFVSLFLWGVLSICPKPY